VGPFRNEADTAFARQWFIKQDAQVQQRTEEQVEAKRFFVYQEAPAQAELVQQRIDELKARGVRDVMPIRDGELQNAISLGFFRTEESANRRVVELQKLGVQAAVLPRHKTKPVYWLSVAALKTEKLPDDAKARFRGLAQVTQVACAEIASPPPPQ
jgi:hypothetical protein